MSLINIGLQSVVLRQKCHKKWRMLRNANCMDEISKFAEKIPELKEYFTKCLAPVPQLLGSTLSRLMLKGELFVIEEFVTLENMDVLSSKFQEVEPAVPRSDRDQIHKKEY